MPPLCRRHAASLLCCSPIFIIFAAFFFRHYAFLSADALHAISPLFADAFFRHAIAFFAYVFDAPLMLMLPLFIRFRCAAADVTAFVMP